LNGRLKAHIKFPSNPVFPFIIKTTVYPYKLYSALCCIQYLLNSIQPANGFKAELVSLIDTCPLAQEKEMGFPPGWKKEQFWS